MRLSPSFVAEFTWGRDGGEGPLCPGLLICTSALTSCGPAPAVSVRGKQLLLSRSGELQGAAGAPTRQGTGKGDPGRSSPRPPLSGPLRSGGLVRKPRPALRRAPSPRPPSRPRPGPVLWPAGPSTLQGLSLEGSTWGHGCGSATGPSPPFSLRLRGVLLLREVVGSSSSFDPHPYSSRDL